MKKDCSIQRGQGTPREHSPQNHLSRDYRCKQRLKWKSWRLQGSALGSLSTYCDCLACFFFVRLETVWMVVSLTYLPALGATFLLLVCLAYPWYVGLCLVLLKFFMPCLVDIPVRPGFSEGERRSIGSWERLRVGRGEGEEGEAAVVMYYMRQEKKKLA